MGRCKFEFVEPDSQDEDDVTISVAYSEEGIHIFIDDKDGDMAEIDLTEQECQTFILMIERALTLHIRECTRGKLLNEKTTAS